MKRCSACKEYKDPLCFYRNKCKKDGLSTECKNCKKQYDKKRVEDGRNQKRMKRYRQTAHGHLRVKYYSMKQRVKGRLQRGRQRYEGLEILDYNSFIDWALNDIDFRNLWDIYKNNNFARPLAPSIDRIDPEKGYTLDNMRFLSLSENSKYTRRWE